MMILKILSMIYYKSNNCELHLGDSKKLICGIKNYDLIFTGPTYGIGINYGIYPDDWIPTVDFWDILYKIE